MTVNVKTEKTKAIVEVEGRVDTTTAPELDNKLNEVIDTVQRVTLDCSKLIYISSAGLRVLLSAHKKMSKKGGAFELSNVGDDIMEIFTITGFSQILSIV